jgi:hypothetical protein
MGSFTPHTAASTLALVARMRNTMLALGLLFVGACGSVATGPATDAGSHREAAVDGAKNHPDAAPDATSDAPSLPPPADGPFACGASSCTATQFCLVPCVDVQFPAPSCAPTGTTCPEGSTATDTSCDGGMMCSFGPAPPQPSCVDAPPCTPDTNYCQVQGRTYTETGCA